MKNCIFKILGPALLHPELTMVVLFTTALLLIAIFGSWEPSRASSLADIAESLRRIAEALEAK